MGDEKKKPQRNNCGGMWFSLQCHLTFSKYVFGIKQNLNTTLDSKNLKCGMEFSSIQSAENRRKERHRFWLRLRHVVILISNNRISASKKINEMALIRTITGSTTAFERTKEKFYGFRQTVFLQVCTPLNKGEANETCYPRSLLTNGKYNFCL